MVETDRQRRLDRIVEWMHTEGDAWLRNPTKIRPATGSDLAADDDLGPPSSPLIHRGIVMALDHLGSVIDDVVAQDTPKRIYAPFTALRTALECAVRTCWLLEPDASQDRLLRSLSVRAKNLDEHAKALESLWGLDKTPDSATARRHEQRRIDANRAALTQRAAAIGTPTVPELLDTVSMIKQQDLPPDLITSLIQLWRVGSATAHGLYWADDMRGNRGAFDYRWFTPAIEGSYALINKAMTLHYLRSAGRA